MEINGRITGTLDNEEIAAIKCIMAAKSQCEALYCDDCVMRTDYGCICDMLSDALNRNETLKRG